MDRKLFQNLIEVLDKIIKANSNLKALFEEKRELLKSAKPDDLGVTDNKIIAVNNQILKLENERKNLAITKIDDIIVYVVILQKGENYEKNYRIAIGCLDGALYLCTGCI